MRAPCAATAGIRDAGSVPTPPVDKAGQRSVVLRRRRDRELGPSDDALASHLASDPRLQGHRAAYEAFGTEPVVPLRPDDLLPVVLPDRDLTWRRGTRLLGPEAVAEADVVLVPALAVDRRGVRLGRGGGSYDRALARARGLVVAVLHDGELYEQDLPEEPHDVRVDAVLLPDGLLMLDGPGVTCARRRLPVVHNASVSDDGVFDDILAANRRYGEDFPHRGVPAPAARGLGVLTCMDSRIDPLRALGLKVGDFKMLRNAGGRLTADMESDVVLASHLLNVRRVLIMPHTLCAMTLSTDAEVSAAIEASAGVDTSGQAWGTDPDQRTRLRHDVLRLRQAPALHPDTVVAGAIYDVDTGLVEIVVP